MTKAQAIETAIRESDKADIPYSTNYISHRAEEIFSASKELNKRRNEYNVLSSRNSGSRVMRPITTLNSLTMPILRDLTVSSAAEFLGEEFWLSLNTMKEKLVAKRVFNEMRARITRGMC